jgi:nucleotide-binding universal stress UspA family protein
MKKKKATARKPAPGAPIVAQLIVNRILATTDFSKDSLVGVRKALALADKINAAVTLLHVIEPPSRLAGLESLLLARDEAGVMAQARSKLTALAESERKGRVTVSSSVRTGKPFHRISTAAAELEADMIVVATHGHTGARRVLLGSTAERVVRHAPCPVLTIPTRSTRERRGKASGFDLKRILVPVDFSEISNKALPWAAYLAAQFEAELILLYVVDRSTISYLLGSELMSHAVMPFIKQAEADLDNMARTLSGSSTVKVSTVVLEGTPYEGISRAA